MELFECFSKDYRLISATGDEEFESIADFLEDIEDGEELKFRDPLQAVFIHKTKNEMFLVLNCLKDKLESIKNTIDEWERNISCFVNFGKEYRKNIDVLKYNISLIILCKEEKGYIDDNFRFETEKSLKICRKIFLICNDSGVVDEDNKSIIPFYFSPVEKIENDETEELERQLRNLLPEDEILSICKKKEFTPEDINKISGWLLKDDNY